MKPETRFQKRCVQVFRGCGAVVLNKQGSLNEGPGWPDLYIAHHSFTGWVELKVGTNPCSNVQKDRMRLLIEQGVPCLVLREKSDAPGVFTVESPDGTLTLGVYQVNSDTINLLLYWFRVLFAHYSSCPVCRKFRPKNAPCH